MVVEANRDAAKECVQKAVEAFKRHDMDKMRSLLARAKKLDPGCDLDSILNGHAANGDARKQSTTEAESDRSYAHDDHYDDAEGLRQRTRTGTRKSAGHKGRNSRAENKETNPEPSTSQNNARASKSRSKSAGRSSSTANKETAEPIYTKEEYELVSRIRHCKDYYEILQVSREFSDSQLKKKYYELALKLHPDKCKVPGATEAFKALGNAYGVLSDAKKREDYDKYGAEESRSVGRRQRSNDFYEYDVGRGFEAEMSPEDIFEMFFGSGFGGRSMNRRQTHFFHTNRPNPQQNAQREDTSPFFQLMQLLPILAIIFGGLIMQLFVGEPAYNLHRDNTYYIQRYTRELRIPYFVKPDFETNYGKKLKQIEQHVEDEYVQSLRSHCYREKNQRESMLWTARMRGDSNLWRQAQDMKLLHCEKLEEIYR